MSRKKTIQGLPLFLLTIIALYSLISGIIIEKPFTWYLYSGIISIAISLIFYFLKYRWFNYFFIIVLFLGSINVLHFTFNEVTITFSLSLFNFINLNTLEIQLLSLVLLLIFVTINIKRIISIVKGFLLSLDD